MTSKGYMTLGDSNWTFCTPWKILLQNEFLLYSQAICSISLFLHTVKVNDFKGYMTFWYSNWTICTPWKLFFQNEFPVYSQATCSITFSCMQMKGHSIMDPTSEWQQGVYDPRGIQSGPFHCFWKVHLRFLRIHIQHCLRFSMEHYLTWVLRCSEGTEDAYNAVVYRLKVDKAPSYLRQVH